MPTNDEALEDDFGSATDLSDMPISALANDKVITAGVNTTILEAAVLLRDEGIGLLVIESDDGVAGVVSERDIVVAVATGADLNGPVTLFGEGQSIHRAVPTSSVSEVATAMMESYIRHVLITTPDGKLEGVVSMRDLLAVVLN